MGSTLLHGGTVLTVDAENRVLEGGLIAIRDGRITGVGPAANVSRPVRLSTRCSTWPGTSSCRASSMPIPIRRWCCFAAAPKGRACSPWRAGTTPSASPNCRLRRAISARRWRCPAPRWLLSGTTTVLRPVFLCRGDRRRPSRQAASAPSSPMASSSSATRRAARTELANATAFIEQQRSADGRMIPWFGPHAPYVDNSEELLRAEVDGRQEIRRRAAPAHGRRAGGQRRDAWRATA